MKNTTHPTAINLIHDIVTRIPVESRGTYNKQDPTAYHRGSIDVIKRDDKIIRLSYNDCGWGVTLRMEIFTWNNDLPIISERNLASMEAFAKCDGGKLLNREVSEVYLSYGIGKNQKDELFPRDNFKPGDMMKLASLVNLLPEVQLEYNVGEYEHNLAMHA